ncbi:MAG: PD-(D/E)XK nuclease-like domain-containing protein [Microbacterium sp.]|uniref:PD-(D/E)XK nuclease-like domain-containing protein n=1 Tax=Microbacterium sp. TaxID=51671 RepID=UPI0025D6B246|nr:PD-(D/E)XK nuclease-like domain-containing protein [Microbacterium sp.]MBQ9917417.1 PD-(D/E)XK nuclease-like domain-containing protein [Microbacterium sp.]
MTVTATPTGFVHGMPENDYHAHPALSSTAAKKLVKSAAHYRHYVNNPHETKDEFDLGSCVHTKVLGVGADIAIYPDGNGPERFTFDDKVMNNVLATNGALSTSAAKAFAADARAQGLIPVKRSVARKVNAMAESVLREPAARKLLENFEPEVSMFATDPVTGLHLRGRVDILGRRIGDLKTTSGDASEDGFAISAFRYGYDIQFGHYDYILELLDAQRPWFWVVVETEAPHLAGVHAMNDDTARMGRDKARLARERLARALETGEYPGYENRSGGPIGIIRPPMFSVYEYQDLFEGEAA